MILALIPARASSRGILRKNMRSLLDWPLIEWTLAAVTHAKRVHQAVVTTDDPAVAALAKRYNVAVIDRPAELAQDDTPDWPVVQHALVALGGPWHEPESLVVFLRPTAPFRRPREIDQAVAWLGVHPEVSSLRSVVPARENPRKQYVEASYVGLPYIALRPYTVPHAANAPRQGLERVWTPVGDIDVVRACWVLRGSMEGPHIAAWRVSPLRAVDLDDEADWQAAEGLARANGWRPGQISMGEGFATDGETEGESR